MILTTSTPQKSLAPQNIPNPSPMRTRKCFKCRGPGYVPSKCPNKRVISLAEWEAIVEEELEEPEVCLMKDQEKVVEKAN